MAVRRIKLKVERKMQRVKEKAKDILGPHTPVSKVSSRESLRAHSASSSGHPQVSAGSTAGEQGDIRGGTTSSLNVVQRSTSEPSAERARTDAEILNPQGLTDTANRELIKYMCNDTYKLISYPAIKSLRLQPRHPIIVVLAAKRLFAVRLSKEAREL
jgi:hypothetical protein